MDWFHNLQVRTKLVFSFSILMLLLGVLTLTSYSSTKEMATLVENMHANQLIPIKDLANANMQAIYTSRALYRYVLENDEKTRKENENNMLRCESNMNEPIDKYRETSLTQPEIDLLARFDQA